MFYLKFSLGSLFFKLNLSNIKSLNTTIGKIKKNTITNLKGNDSLLLLLFKCLFFLLLFIFSFKNFNIIFFWNSFIFKEFVTAIFNIIIYCALIVIYMQFCSDVKFNYDFNFFFSKSLVIFMSFIIFIVNNILVFYVTIEAIALLFFYNFVLSKNWNMSKNLKNEFLNSLFFSYWSGFLSSIFYLLSTSFIVFSFYSLEINLVSFLQNNILVNSNKFIYFFFFVAIIIKMGFSPLQLYKLEVYKGLSLFILIFYTTFFFLVFFLFFSQLILIDFIGFNFIAGNLIYIFLIVSISYLFVSMFNVNSVKYFFAYSTIFNSTSFITFISVAM